MKTTNKKEIRVNVSILNNVAKGIAKEIQLQKNAAKKERKNLTQTINYLCQAETEEGNSFRVFFNLQKNANKNARKECAKYILSRLTNALEVYKIECTENCEPDEVERVFIKLIPCTKNGKEITDYLDVVTNIVKAEKVNRPKLLELGKQIKNLWGSEGAKKESDKVKYANALKNTFAKKIETYRIKTKILGSVIMK